MGAAGSIPKSFTIPAALECIGEDTINTDQIPENVLSLFGLADSIEEGNLRRDQLLLLLAATSACESHPGILAALEDVVKSFLARAGGDADLCGATLEGVAARSGDVAKLVQAYSASDDIAASAWSPLPGERVYALRGAFFWPALVTAVRDAPTLVVDLEYLHPEGIAGGESVATSVDVLEVVRPPDDDPWAWIATTETRTRFDWAYYREADGILCLIVSGAVETDSRARGVVKRWFETRFNLGSNANGADLWSFTLARAAAKLRLRALGAKLNQIYEDEALETKLGNCAASMGVEGAKVRADSNCDGACARFVMWARSESEKKTASDKMKGNDIFSMTNDDALDYAVVHLLRMLGLALDPLFAEAMAQLFGTERVKVAPVKKAARMKNKLELDHAHEPYPRSAANTDVIRCGATASTPAQLVDDFSRLAAMDGVRIVRTKNGWMGGDAAGAARAERFHYASLLVNLEFAPPGLTYGELARRAAAMWTAYAESLPTWDRTLATEVLSFLESDAIATTSVTFLGEVQLQYEPYVTHGRLKTHLHYKFARATTSTDLLLDFRTSSKYVDADNEAAFREAAVAYSASFARQPEADVTTVRLDT